MIDTDVAQSKIEDLIVAWSNAIAEIMTIVAHPNAPRPAASSYAAVNIISSGRRRKRSLGPIYYEDVVDGEGVDRVVQTNAEEWEWTASIGIYGVGALDYARRLVNSLEIGTNIIDYFTPLHVAEVSLVRRIPELVENEWENRANFDLTLHGVVLDGYLVDVVQHGEIEIIRRLQGSVNAEEEYVIFGDGVPPPS
jgi:hypothetical protein